MTPSSNAEPLPQLASACNYCAKAKGVVKLLQCSRCGERWYCGKDCQLAAWKQGHKTECLQLATARLETLVKQLGGEDKVSRFLNSMLSVMPTPPDLERLHTLQLLCKTLADQDEEVMQWYFVILAVLARNAGAKKGVKAQVLSKEMDAALQKHRAKALVRTHTVFVLVTKFAMQLLASQGRKAEAAALGRRELPGIEALAPKGVQGKSLLAHFMLNLAQHVTDGGQEEWSQHCDRSHSKQGEVCEGKEERASEAFAEATAEGEALAKRALVFAEAVGSPIQGAELFGYLYRVALIVAKRFAFTEALPYARRAYEMAPPKRIPDAVKVYAQALYRLGNYTEAEKVLRCGLAHLPDPLACVNQLGAVEARATFHLLLGRVLLDRGELNEALSHATLGRQLVRAHWTALRAGMGLQLSQLWDLGGDVLEKMGRLQEAREWDHDAEHLVGTIINSARRRALQELVRKGDHEKAERRAREGVRVIQATREASMLPSDEQNTVLEAFAEVLETVAGGDPETAALVRNIRADVAENRAIREALRQKLLQETREEAAAAVAHDGSRVGDEGDKGGTQGKKGKRKKNKRKKARGGKGGKQKGDGEAREQEGQAKADDRAAANAEAAAEAGAEVEAVEEAEETPECAICLLDLQGDEEDEEEATVLACGHTFHSACVTLWVKNCSSKKLETTCPICRAIIIY